MPVVEEPAAPIGEDAVEVAALQVLVVVGEVGPPGDMRNVGTETHLALDLTDLGGQAIQLETVPGLELVDVILGKIGNRSTSRRSHDGKHAGNKQKSIHAMTIGTPKGDLESDGHPARRHPASGIWHLG